MHGAHARLNVSHRHSLHGDSDSMGNAITRMSSADFGLSMVHPITLFKPTSMASLDENEWKEFADGTAIFCDF